MTPSQLFFQVLIVALSVLGYCALYWPGMILEQFKEWLDEHVPDILQKPLYSCFICAVPWWGTLVYITVFNTGDIFNWFITMAAAVGFNAGLAKFIGFVDKVTETLEQDMEMLDNDNPSKS